MIYECSICAEQGGLKFSKKSKKIYEGSQQMLIKSLIFNILVTTKIYLKK